MCEVRNLLRWSLHDSKSKETQRYPNIDLEKSEENARVQIVNMSTQLPCMFYFLPSHPYTWTELGNSSRECSGNIGLQQSGKGSQTSGGQ
jgi:hypothetical protein